MSLFCLFQFAQLIIPYQISEHFAAGGKPLGDLIVDVVRHTAEKAAST